MTGDNPLFRSFSNNLMKSILSKAFEASSIRIFTLPRTVRRNTFFCTSVFVLQDASNILYFSYPKVAKDKIWSFLCYSKILIFHKKCKDNGCQKGPVITILIFGSHRRICQWNRSFDIVWDCFRFLVKQAALSSIITICYNRIAKKKTLLHHASIGSSFMLM